MPGHENRSHLFFETGVSLDEAHVCFPASTRVVTDIGILQIGEIVEQKLDLRCLFGLVTLIPGLHKACETSHRVEKEPSRSATCAGDA